MSDLPKRVFIDEEGPREGFQSEPPGITVANKVRLIEALAETGLKRINCVSYVNPRRVPSMADAEEVASGIRRKPGVGYSALYLNQQGLERALKGPLDVHGSLRTYASETFSRKNIGKSLPDGFIEQRGWMPIFRQHHIPVEWGIVLGAFGCNYEGDVAPQTVALRVQQILDEARLLGVTIRGIKLTDATGWATPLRVERAIGAVRERFPDLEISLHLHDTRGVGMAAAYAGLRMGVTRFDSSIAGLGGCPFAATPGAVGNICTEDLVFMCEEMGIDTGLNLDALIEAAFIAEDVVGRKLPGHVKNGGSLEVIRRRNAASAAAA